jgi:hypothetical protein
VSLELSLIDVRQARAQAREGIGLEHGHGRKFGPSGKQIGQVRRLGLGDGRFRHGVEKKKTKKEVSAYLVLAPALPNSSKRHIFVVATRHRPTQSTTSDMAPVSLPVKRKKP